MFVPILILALSCQGYWIGGQQGTVLACYVVPSYPSATMHWRLVHAELELASGQVAIETNGRPTRIALDVPDVRAVTSMMLEGEVRATADGRTLGRFQRRLTVYPATLPDPAIRRAADRLLVIARPGESLAQFMQAKGMADRLSDSLPAMSDRSIIVVGTLRDDLNGFMQNQLLDLARQGAQILVLHQRRERLFGYNLVRRSGWPAVAWIRTHPLLLNMDEELSMLLIEDEVYSIRTPAGDDAVRVAGWDSELPGRTQQATDNLLMTKSIGRGRIVLCQLPWNDWHQDPRQQQFLANALDYLTTPPLVTDESLIEQAGGVP